MVKKKENGIKEYKVPQMKVVIVEAGDIIATSGSTEGRGSDFDVDEDW